MRVLIDRWQMTARHSLILINLRVNFEAAACIRFQNDSMWFYSCAPNSNRYISTHIWADPKCSIYWVFSKHIDNACLFFYSKYTANTSTVMDGRISYTLLALDALCFRLPCHLFIYLFFSLSIIRRFIDWYFKMCSWRLTHLWHKSALEWMKLCSQQPTASIHQDQTKRRYFWNSHTSYLLNWYVYSRILLNFANNDRKKKWFPLRRVRLTKKRKKRKVQSLHKISFDIVNLCMSSMHKARGVFCIYGVVLFSSPISPLLSDISHQRQWIFVRRTQELNVRETNAWKMSIFKSKNKNVNAYAGIKRQVCIS